MNFGFFTNGVYEVFGFTTQKRLIGVCTSSKYDSVKAPGQFVNWPLYHLKTDKKPQFYKIRKKTK